MRTTPAWKTIVAAGLLATAGSSALAQASGSFACITNNSAASCAQGTSALSWTWTGTVFTIFNAAIGGGYTGYVSEVYFDLTAPMTVSFNSGASSATGVGFTLGASPPALPGGNSYGFTSDAAFDSDRRRESPTWGIDPGEHAAFSFSGAALGSFDVGALASGVHVRRLVNGQSESFVTTAVPEPSTYALMLAGLGLVGFMARRRRSTS